MTAGGAGLQGMRILVVEDNYFIANEICGELQARGANVLGPVGGLSGAQAIIEAEQSLDRAVLDVDLRGEKVFPVADMLAARNVPFVFATGYDDVVIPERFASYPRCLKPLNYNQLADRLA
jgi:DNA-binding response OmpR family regulator